MSKLLFTRDNRMVKNRSSYLVLCAFAGTYWVTSDPSYRMFGGKHFCPKHAREFMEGFDPQPFHVTKIGEHIPQNTVHHRLDPFPREYLVLDRKGDRVTIRPMANPDVETEEVSLDDLYPVNDHNISMSVGCSDE
jgi:hypothetical protein